MKLPKSREHHDLRQQVHDDGPRLRGGVRAPTSTPSLRAAGNREPPEGRVLAPEVHVRLEGQELEHRVDDRHHKREHQQVDVRLQEGLKKSI